RPVPETQEAPDHVREVPGRSEVPAEARRAAEVPEGKGRGERGCVRRRAPQGRHPQDREPAAEHHVEPAGPAEVAGGAVMKRLLALAVVVTVAVGACTQIGAKGGMDVTAKFADVGDLATGA